MPNSVFKSGFFRAPPGSVSTQAGLKPLSPSALGVRVVVLLLPTALLLLSTLRTRGSGTPQLLLLLGTAFQVMVCGYNLGPRQSWREPLGRPVLILYLTALAWVWLAAANLAPTDWYLQLVQAVLLIVSIAVFAVQFLQGSGAPEMRRGQLLAQRLASRKNWPDDLAACRALPEVKPLREAIQGDPAPALSLLRDPRPEVRIGALAALEFRKQWLPGQAELVLEVAKRSEEPAVRAAAVNALANVDDRLLVERLAEFLCDPSAEVRRAASEALLWDTERRWGWIRHAVRRALAETAPQEEGPLLQDGQVLSSEAIKDLTAWASEKDILAIRAAMTLAVHFGRALNEQPHESLIVELRKQVSDAHAPATLRLELAQLLLRNHFLDQALQEKLLDPLNPSPLRLLAADALLARGEHEGAVAALRDIARLPNREIALATADVVQRRLGVDLGLALGQPLPPVHSRNAAEVTRRVMTWASGKELLDQAAAIEPVSR